MRGFEKAPPQVRTLLRRPIKKLGLKLEGSPVERFVTELYRELSRRGLSRFRPRCYLTDEWGCPSGEPVIGIPFYLADSKLAALEKAVNDLEDEREIMMYLRHEAGHAFNYAYELYRTARWRSVFGSFRRAYREDYRPVPFSRRYVRHIAGWYAQKHPDEDFAETFAVWLTPHSGWRRKYRGWPAMRKLLYVDRVARGLSGRQPRREMGRADVTVEEMDATIGEFYRRHALRESEEIEGLPLDADLENIFIRGARRRRGTTPAADFIALHRKELVDNVASWTGVRRPLIQALVAAVLRRVGALRLWADRSREAAHLVALAAYVATLANTSLAGGQSGRP